MKALKFSGLFLILTAIAFPLLIFAIAPGSVPRATDFGIKGGVTVESPDKLLNILGKAVKYVYYAFFVVAVLFIVLAAYDYLTKSGQPEEIKKVHQKLLYAVIAIVVALLAVGAETIITEFLGGKGGGGGSTGAQNIKEQQWYKDSVKTWEGFFPPGDGETEAPSGEITSPSSYEDTSGIHTETNRGLPNVQDMGP